MKRRGNRIRAEMNAARRMWGSLGRETMKELQSLVVRHNLSISDGDVLFLANHWYVTHSGLLRCAHRHRCSGIKTTLESQFSDPAANRWVFRATVYGSNRLKSFVGYGDADPSNVSLMVRGAEMRIAETRAVNRALRKAYGIGLCSVEEIGSNPGPMPAHNSHKSPPNGTNGNGSGNGSGHKVRDRLCQIVRQHKLDPELVKAYAVDFCGTKVLKDASREQVESFVQQLADAAKKDRNALLCQLNSYARPSQEVVG